MFVAIVMVCSLVREGDCMKFADNRGPYFSEELCIARVQKMIEGVSPTLPDEPKKFMYKCDDETGTPV